MKATSRTPRQTSEALSTPVAPQSTPHAYGLPGHDFTLQAVMELHKSVGETNAVIQGMKSSLDSVKSKVDDLVGWKHRIAGGLAAIAVVFAVLGYVIGKASDYITLKIPSAATAAQAPPQPTLAPPVAPQGKPTPKPP